MGGRSISDELDDEPAQLDWETPGGGAFIAVVLVIVALMFVYWALPIADARGESPGFLGLFRIGGFGLGHLLVAGLLAWVAAVYAWRAADSVAMVVDRDGLRLHRTLGGGRIPWAEVSHVALSLDSYYSGIELGFMAPQRLGFGPLRELNPVITGLDLGGGQAERFVAAAERFQRAAEARAETL